MQEFESISIDDVARFEEQLFAWAASFKHCSILQSNPNGNYTYPDAASFEVLIGCGAKHFLDTANQDPFEALKQFRDQHSDWLFGHFSYDLKNRIEALSSKHANKIGFEDISFFVPTHIFKKAEDNWFYKGIDAEQALLDVFSFKPSVVQSKPVQLEPTISHATYISKVMDLQHHIQLGDIYEANYCQEFAAENAEINPIQTYHKLMAQSPTPFAGFYRNGDSHLLCASPERFLKKKGRKLTSQPIKGTAKRGKTPKEDREQAAALVRDPKERSENVMIVDLVRNDLSHYASKGSVRVEELFGCYTFPQVHQLISTVTAELKPEVDAIDALKMAFPMGSMTGAPKIRAMELIEKAESFRRGLYSGSIGYITPDGDFDFNVVIRSILYNASSGYVSCPVGGAITIKAKPESEYEESLLKAQASIDLLKEQ